MLRYMYLLEPHRTRRKLYEHGDFPTNVGEFEDLNLQSQNPVLVHVGNIGTFSYRTLSTR